MTCGCGKPLPELAVRDGDEFCSMRCAQEFFGSAPTHTSSGSATGGRPAGGPPEPRTALQRCRALQAELAAERRVRKLLAEFVRCQKFSIVWSCEMEGLPVDQWCAACAALAESGALDREGVRVSE